MSVSHSSLAAVRRRSGVDLFFLIISGVLFGTGGLAGRLVSLATSLSPISVAAYRLVIAGVLILLFRAVRSRRRSALACPYCASDDTIGADRQPCCAASHQDRAELDARTVDSDTGTAWPRQAVNAIACRSSSERAGTKCRSRGRHHQPAKGRRIAVESRRIAVIAVLSALYQAAYLESVSLTSVTVSTLITIGALPVFVAAIEHVTGRRRLERQTVATVGVALAGLALLVGVPSGGFTTTTALTGTGLALASAAGFAATTTVAAGFATRTTVPAGFATRTTVPAGFATTTTVAVRPMAGLDDLTAIGVSFTFGGVLLMPLGVVAGGVTFRPDVTGVGLLLALGTVPTAVAYTLYFRGLRSINAVTAALTTLLEPLTSAILGAVVLRDRLGLAGMCGAGILAAAVILAARTTRHPSANTTPNRHATATPTPTPTPQHRQRRPQDINHAVE